MQGLTIGHYTDVEHQTGASIFLFENPAVGAYQLCGTSPATRELNTLDLDANITHANALAFVGGSALGLGAVDGALQWLQEQHHGWPALEARIPIVPTAAIYDFGVGQVVPPTSQGIYQACVSAQQHNRAAGRVGAGTGASVGKLLPNGYRMSGGLGYAEMTLTNGVTVVVYAVVNSVGDVRERSGKIISGAKNTAGQFVDCEKYLLTGHVEKSFLQDNTTLVAIFTNAIFSRIELKRIAKMATAGMARVISPIFTRYDGDIIFSFSLGNKIASELVVGTLAADLTSQAILNAVKDAVFL